MRRSKPLLTRRIGILILSLLFTNLIGAYANLTADVAVPFSSSNKATLSDIIVPLQHQHSVEKLQGTIQATTPTNFSSIKANYKAAPINIHPEKSYSSTGNLYKSPSGGNSATARLNTGGGAFATAKHIAPKKTKTIQQTHKALTQVGAAQPVIMRVAAADSDDDDDWNPGGTGGFDNPGEPPVIPVPVGNGILPLMLMAIAYALKQNRKK
ncbi:MAG: hypothetical protein J6V13_07290 [Paludibacteraceae bacterium]|nr:hypothetical protein [Paludibacteraceae bacterium]